MGQGGDFPVAQWLGIDLPMQATEFGPLAPGTKTPRATGQLRPCATNTKPHVLGPVLCSKRSRHREKPARATREQHLLPATRGKLLSSSPAENTSML